MMRGVSRACCAVLLWLVGLVQALAAERAVSDTSGLIAALNAAQPGDVLVLAPGNYGSVQVRNVSGAPGQPITLRSADPENPAVLGQLQVRNSAHMVFEHLFLDHTYTPGDDWRHPANLIHDSQDITLRDSVLDGDKPYDLDELSAPYGTAFGMFLRRSSDIVFQGNEVRDFYRGLVVLTVDRLTITDNDFHTNRMDGMTLAQVTDTLIAGNRIRDFNRSVKSGDHADMIQFWTASTNTPTVNVTIRDNILNSGTGAETQSIFMRNEMVDTGRAGPEMLYRNIRIENNVIINAHPNAINIGETDGLVIANNTLIRNRASVGDQHRAGFYTPQIRIKKDAVNVQVTGNITPVVVEPRRAGNWVVENNFIIQDDKPSLANHYDKLFANPIAGDPRDLANFAYKAGGPLDGAGLGSDLLNRARFGQ